MKQLKLSRLFSLLLALTLALTPCLAGLAEEGNESQNSMDIVLRSGTVTGVTVSENAVTMWVGEDKSFGVTVSPEGATNKNWTSSTSNASIASLSGKSTIHAVAPGTAIITVTTEDGKKTATITVTVTQQVGEIRLSADKTTLKVGGTAKVTANVLPENASNKGVTFTSSHSTVATVDANGNVQAASAGTTTITTTAADGKGAYGTITIKVEDMATGVTLSPTSKELKVNETAQLAASVLPATANQGIKFTSSDETVATVSETGLVTARKEGTAVITATAADGSEKSASCTIKVGATAVDVPVTGITLDQPEITIEVLKDAKQLKATVEPANATNKDVVFSSSNTNVAAA